MIIMKKYHVLYTADMNYFSHMMTSIYSLLETNKDANLVIHIIEAGFTEVQKNLLFSIVSDYNTEVKLYSLEKLDSIIKKYNIPKWRGTDIANARLLASEIIKETDRILYLDSDTIVYNSLGKLFERKTAFPVSAVKDLGIPDCVKPLVDNYYNSGVLLLDYNLWENERCIERLYDCMQDKSIELYYPDQDLMNIALKGSIDTLTANYNVTPTIWVMEKYRFFAKRNYAHVDNFYSMEEAEIALNNPYIFHMLSYLTTRPWIENNVHPFNSLYQGYRKSWDNNFKLEKNNEILLKLPFLPFLRVASGSILSREQIDKVKQKLKIKEVI